MTETRSRTAPPNFAARRMLVSAAVIALVVVAISVVWRWIDGDDGPSLAAPVRWDAIAFVDQSDGAVTLLDPDGAVLDEFAGEGRVLTVHAAASSLALVRGTSVELLDLAVTPDNRDNDNRDNDNHDSENDNEPADGRRQTIELPDQARAIVRLPTAHDRLMLAGGHRNGGPVRLIDGRSGRTYDLDRLAELDDPRLYTASLRVDPEASTVAVADAANFQTILVRGLGSEAELTTENFADQPLAVSRELLATTQVVGTRADLSVYALGRDPLTAPVATGIPAGAAIIDGRLLVVTKTGDVLAVRVGDRQARQLTTLDLPEGRTVDAVYQAANGRRLVIYAGTSVAVVDGEGNVVYQAELPSTGARFGTTTTTTTNTATNSTTPGSTPNSTTAPAGGRPSGRAATSTTSAVPAPTTIPTAADPIEPSAPLAPAWEWNCLAVGLGTRAAALISLDSGELLADLDNIAVVDTSADGCVVVGTDRGVTVIVGGDHRGELDGDAAVTLSPDGRMLVRRTVDGATELIPLDGDLQPGQPRDVTDALPSATTAIAFVTR